jgi:hypothetical protein
MDWGCTAEEITPVVAALVRTRRKNTRLVVDALTEDSWIKEILENMPMDSSEFGG